MELCRLFCKETSQLSNKKCSIGSRKIQMFDAMGTCHDLEASFLRMAFNLDECLL